MRGISSCVSSLGESRVLAGLAALMWFAYRCSIVYDCGVLVPQCVTRCLPMLSEYMVWWQRRWHVEGEAAVNGEGEGDLVGGARVQCSSSGL